MYTDKTKIKLCGLTRTDDIEAVNALQPDFIGFVFAEKKQAFCKPGASGTAQKKALYKDRVCGCVCK